MNRLQQLIANRNLPHYERIVMDYLQEHGRISDNAVTPADVDPGDAERAVAWLKEPFLNAEVSRGD